MQKHFKTFYRSLLRITDNCFLLFCFVERIVTQGNYKINKLMTIKDRMNIQCHQNLRENNII